MYGFIPLKYVVLIASEYFPRLLLVEHIPQKVGNGIFQILRG